MTDFQPEDFFDNAPCGLLCATTDRRITAVNAVLADWLGYSPNELVGRQFTELFSAGARIHYETHFAPLLQVNLSVAEMAIDLVRADATRLPVLITANAKGSPQLIRMAIHDARKRRSYERELLDERRRAEAEQARAELLAATLQRSLLPPSLSPPPSVQAIAHYHAATGEVGGDFYDLFPLAGDTWGFFLGDVAGKGAAAAAVTSLTRYTLRAAAVMSTADPVSVLHTVDKVLKQRAPRDAHTFATVIVGTLRPSPSGIDVHLASGGHPPALLLGSAGEVREVSTAGGQPVGILARPDFVATRLRLVAGDTLLLYSDGLTEARTGRGRERYDDDGALLRFAQAHAPSTAADLLAALQGLLTDLGRGVEDDVALLALGVPAGQ